MNLAIEAAAEILEEVLWQLDPPERKRHDVNNQRAIPWDSFHLWGPSVLDRIVMGPEECCWEWRGVHDSKGYSIFTLPGHRVFGVHRIVAELFHGERPAGWVTDHLCRNHGCVNQNHLEHVPFAENIRRGCVSRGVVRKPRRPPLPRDENGLLLYCRRGHAFSGENVAMVEGHRVCRICRNTRSLADYYRRKRAA